jgi:diamine N-acetyltransferase
VYADELVVGHVMWAVDDDRSHWIGGLVVAAAEQSVGIGRAATQTMVRWLAERAECDVVLLSYDGANTDAARLYTELGFRPTGACVDGEVVVELRV